MAQPPSDFPWHPIPSSSSDSTCKVYLLQAGGLAVPEALTLLPGPNEPNASLDPKNPEPYSKKFYAPDYVFLIKHLPTGNHYIFDLGMRKDLHNLPPSVVKGVLPAFDCEPKSPAEILKEHGSPEQQPEHVKAVIFSHMHFDHVGDGAKAGFAKAELWIGPTCCTYARPGYPEDEKHSVLSEDLPMDGSRRIVEAFVSDALLEKAGDKRVGKVAQAKSEGLYKAVELRDPGDKGWIGLGPFDRGFDVFSDGVAYIIDAPGHVAGHQMMLVRVKTNASGDDDFVLLAGDSYHHPSLLKDPRLTARPPYSKSSMHSDPEVAMDTMGRAKTMSEKVNILVVGAHDPSVGEAIAPGQKEIMGLVELNDWRRNGWKKPPQASL
ncbi:hypothetical protein BU26DRAFT_164119 [Trematosphaeria pertusa]|uniref:Metallo-beta-lactamase domain-containing protein n=1 Tax=Trematosphaeria pertusa TaxID=390896 RepID=A0A6A6HV17_9PLEO|nr:uncharacterized protein BU26DRAFT_164119 [Trematosphaeria pertusa]KAF2242035.1 hypothetical protein BU26DRAFT_164119 [Trematosphaeria pertusa]